LIYFIPLNPEAVLFHLKCLRLAFIRLVLAFASSIDSIIFLSCRVRFTV
jgi:hypothetical protein